MDASLLTGLAGVAGVVLVGVLGHGLWRTRRASPRRAEGADAPRVEPRLDAAGVTPHAATAADPHADALADAAATSAPAAAGDAEAGAADAALPLPRPAAARRTLRLDPLIDAIATLAAEAPVSGELALSHLPPSRRAGTKPVLIEGLNLETGDWETPAPGQRYREFQAGVQLANRTGALNEIEYSEFVQKLQAFAEGLGAAVEAPDMLDVVGRARELDTFAGAHDAQLTLTLRANQAAWTTGFILQAAGRHGFVAGALPGRLVLPATEEGAPPVLTLSFDAQAALADDPNAHSVWSVQLALDVPQTAEASEPFPAWHQSARLLAADLDATMMDDQGRAVTLHAFASIGEDLNLLYRALESRDLAAGSAAARRLFS